MTNNTRLDEIVERNSRSRVVDIAFAAMVAALLTFGLVSFNASAARPLHPTVAGGQACVLELDTNC
jgi:hypothetical protein